MEKSGFDRKLALEILLPLVRGTINNIYKEGTKNALTGPIVRGDYLTVKKELTEIAKQPASCNNFASSIIFSAISLSLPCTL